MKILKDLYTQVLIYKKYIFLGFFAVLLVAIWWITKSLLDPDFGWHIRMGQVILARGIPATDPFSYTMPSYPFVDYEWLTNIIIALLYPHLHMIGISIIFTVIAYCSLLIQVPLKYTRWLFIPLVLSFGVFSGYIGVRLQVISWLFFSIVLVSILNNKLWQHIRWFLPLLFLLWANLHGGFPLGVFILAIFVLVHDLQTKSITWINWLLLGCSLCATFINPYGYRNWGEVLGIVGNSSLHFSIQEWLPTFFTVNYYLLLLIPFSLTMIGYTHKKFSLLEKILYIFLFIFGLSSSRNIPYWIIIALPMTIRATNYFVDDLVTIQFAEKRFSIGYAIYSAIVVIVLLLQITPSIVTANETFTESFYPVKAIRYLTIHPSKGNVFAPYEWGGYLIWKYPQKKVFVDGRMPTWKQKGSSTESANAFAESLDIITGSEPLSEAVNKYDIDTVLLHTSSLTQKPEKETIFTSLNKLFHLPDANIPYLVAQMKQVGMKEVYNDTVTVIFRKTSP